MRFGLLVLGALISTIIAVESVVALPNPNNAVATTFSTKARDLYGFTADEEERARGFPGEADHQPWWPNFKAWFKKTFFFWRRHSTNSTRRLR
ncbi:hypothetical protein ON010_g7430 [Phytophthora cinnamomi]|nr:hypothetical protein ON010_g7430 [Phytophthora cinnamomi]